MRELFFFIRELYKHKYVGFEIWIWEFASKVDSLFHTWEKKRFLYFTIKYDVTSKLIWNSDSSWTHKKLLFLSQNSIPISSVTFYMARLLFNLIQLNIFWTPNILICAKWHHLKHGYFDFFRIQQLSYMILDFWILLKIY
jgi:hypothetical protein